MRQCSHYVCAPPKRVWVRARRSLQLRYKHCHRSFCPPICTSFSEKTGPVMQWLLSYIYIYISRPHRVRPDVTCLEITSTWPLFRKVAILSRRNANPPLLFFLKSFLQSSPAFHCVDMPDREAVNSLELRSKSYTLFLSPRQARRTELLQNAHRMFSPERR